MPKVRWETSGEDIDNLEPDEERDFYEGDIPPRGVYRLNIREIEYVKFKSGSKGLKIFVVVDETNPKKKKYNGAPYWENVVDGESTSFKIRQFLDAIGATGSDWAGTIVNNENKVTKIGKIVINDKLFVRAAVKVGANQSGEPRGEIVRFLSKTSAKDSSADDSDDSDGDDEGEAPF